MGKLPKFLICRNPLYSEDNLFIFCTIKPEMMIRVINPNGAFKLEIEKIYSDDTDKAEGALKRAYDWFIAYRNIQKTNKF